MPWVNRSSAHELDGGISVKPTQTVIVHDVPNFYYLPLFYLIQLGLLHFSQIAHLSSYLPFIHHQLSAGNLFTCQCPILNYAIRHIAVSTFRMKNN